MIIALAFLALSQATLGEGPDVGDVITRHGRPLQYREVIYVGEDHIQLHVEFQNEWLNYSMVLMGDLFEDDVVEWWDYQGPWYPGNETWWSFSCDWKARARTYGATLVINRTYPDGTNESVPIDLVIDYVVAIEISDIYLLRSSDFFLVIEVEIFFNCTDLEVWLAPMAHHDAEVEEWSRARCTPGVYEFRTPLPGGTPYPGAPPPTAAPAARPRRAARRRPTPTTATISSASSCRRETSSRSSTSREDSSPTIPFSAPSDASRTASGSTAV